MMTCTDVPALAGSTPRRARPKGRAEPTSTDDSTMKNRDAAMAAELVVEPDVR